MGMLMIQVLRNENGPIKYGICCNTVLMNSSIWSVFDHWRIDCSSDADVFANGNDVDFGFYEILGGIGHACFGIDDVAVL